jgi:hypothetical protein
MRGTFREDGESETRGESPSPEIRALLEFRPLPASGGEVNQFAGTAQPKSIPLQTT